MLLLLVAFSACLAFAGCGNGTQDRPVALDRDAVPFGLLDETSTTTPTTTVPTTRYAFVVYFRGDDGLAQAIRTSSSPPDAKVVTAALLAGPTRAEVQIGMRTAIPPGAVLGVRKVAGKMATVDLGRPFLQISGAEQKVALTQIVFTMTRLQGVTQVRFLLEGDPVSVLRANGTVTRLPVSRSDYTTTRK
jgi:spore germination protein GerM